MAQIVVSILFLQLPVDCTWVGLGRSESPRFVWPMGCLADVALGVSLQTIDHPASQLDCCLVLGVAPLDVVQWEFSDISDAG